MGVDKVEPGSSDPGGASSYKSFAGPEVKVDINDLFGFYQEMQDIQLDASGPATMEVAGLGILITEGLNTPGGDAGVFPEGAVAAQMMKQSQSDFQHFMKDVLDGIRNIGSAATVVAEIYDGTDKESAAKLDDINFAFSDPGAKPPAGFRKVESWSEYEQQMAEKSGQMSMAAMGDDTYARSYSPAMGVTIYVYPDGSSKQVVTSTSGDRYSNGTTTTTTLYAPGGKVIQTSTDKDQSVYGGYHVRSNTTTQGDSKDGSTSTTSTVTDPGGTKTVTNESTSTTTDEHGKSTSTTIKSDPVTIAPSEHQKGSDTAGPVEQAENQLGSQGEKWFVDQAGQGY